MGLARFIFTTSLLLFSLLILASAGDYAYTSSNSEGDKSNSQVYKYTSKSEDKFKMEGYSYKSNSYDHNSKQENHGYTHDLDVETSKSKEESKQGDYGYISKPDKVEHYESKLVDHDHKSYVDKSDNNVYGYKPEGTGYGRKMGFYKSKEESKQGDYDYVSKSKEMEHYKSKLINHDHNSYVEKAEDNAYGQKVDDIYNSKSKSDSKPAYNNNYNSKQEIYKPNANNNGHGYKQEVGNGYAAPKSTPTPTGY